MELDELKSAWNNIEAKPKPIEEMRLMLLENKHPVLKGIRQQMAIEIAAWAVFLLCYYSMFDGDLKPAWINIMLIVSVVLPLIHSVMGYKFARYLVNGTNIRASLQNYLAKVKVYAMVSIISRLFLLAGFLLFFTYGTSFNPGKYVSIAVIILLFLIQLLLLCRLWAKRLKNLRKAVTLFL